MHFLGLTSTTSLPNDNILGWSRFKGFADDKIKENEMSELKFVLEGVERREELCKLLAFILIHFTIVHFVCLLIL